MGGSQRFGAPFRIGQIPAEALDDDLLEDVDIMARAVIAGAMMRRVNNAAPRNLQLISFRAATW
jgi:hypothetical protein